MFSTWLLLKVIVTIFYTHNWPLYNSGCCGKASYLEKVDEFVILSLKFIMSVQLYTTNIKG